MRPGWVCCYGRCGCFGVAFLPMLVGIVMMASIVTTYVVAVVNGHVEAFLPYISDTGVMIPESCIFSQFLNIAAALAAVTMFLRYRLIQDLTQGMDTGVSRLSKVNLVLALIASVGLSIVGNFQETKIEFMHFTGAGLVFAGGLVYMLLDSIVSFKMCPAYCGKYICQVRITMTLIGFFSLFTTVIAGGISRSEWNPPGDERLRWSSDDPGYVAHLISTFGEWFMAFCFLLYFFTYIRDFQKYDFEIKTTLSVSHLDEEPVMAPDENTRLLV